MLAQTTTTTISLILCETFFFCLATVLATALRIELMEDT